MPRFAAVFPLLVLAACSEGGVSSIAPGPNALAPAFEQSRPVVPNSCNMVKNVRVGNHGGSFTLPKCAGWKGTITFPLRNGNHETRSWSIQTSVTNNFGVPAPPSGTAIFYISMGAGVSTFQENSGNDLVTGPGFMSDHTYSLMVYNLVVDDQCRTPPCPPWFANIGSPTPGSHSISFQSPLNQADLIEAPIIWQFIQS